MNVNIEQSELANIFEKILANETLIYQQNEQMLLMAIKQENRMDDLYSVVNKQSQSMNEINQKLGQLYLKLSDVEINMNVNGDNAKDALDECRQISTGLQEIGNKIDRLKIYKTIYEGDI
jgi:DNA repair ATPase RecN